MPNKDNFKEKARRKPPPTERPPALHTPIPCGKENGRDNVDVKADVIVLITPQRTDTTTKAETHSVALPLSDIKPVGDDVPSTCVYERSSSFVQIWGQ